MPHNPQARGEGSQQTGLLGGFPLWQTENKSSRQDKKKPEPEGWLLLRDTEAPGGMRSQMDDWAGHIAFLLGSKMGDVQGLMGLAGWRR